MTPEQLTKLRERLESLKCINGAMYFGSVEKDGCDCKTRCQNEQTYEHALEELVAFIEKEVSEAYLLGRSEVREFPKHEASLHITHNQHKAYYEKIQDYIEDRRIGEWEWATPTSEERAIKANSLWEVQWYPDTPVGSYTRYGETLEEILESITITQLTEKQ